MEVICERRGQSRRTGASGDQVGSMVSPGPILAGVGEKRRGGTCFSLSRSEKTSAMKEHRPCGQRKRAQKVAASYPGGSGQSDKEAGVAAWFPLHMLVQSADHPVRDQ